ncbi:PUA-like domain-containing protein [Epithele typhae]|uniref:PUA-like domain-containing protein n=1 Tax=Epithele typhae TaxID=378194 RepID=UPI002007C947|nr:PUA-like domain-containing protein [Epithele typhae]KAH9918942.1 PUA-like domain-containing protein [Epithele typhae]
MAPQGSRTWSHVQPDFEQIIPANEFGAIEQVPVLSTFASRTCLYRAAVHKRTMAGISGTKSKGCTSIVMSGGYEDDRDEGDSLTYTGAGGRITKNGEAPRDGPQSCDQTWQNGSNAALKMSVTTRKPVRVVRGFQSNSKYAPAAGYRYDGLYTVEQAWMDTGRSGFQVCRFRLVRLPDQPPIPRRGEGRAPFDHSRWPTPIRFPWINVVTGESSRDTHPSDLPRPTSRPALSSRPTPGGSRTRVDPNVDLNSQPASGNAGGPSRRVRAGPSSRVRADLQLGRSPAAPTVVPPTTNQMNRLSRQAETPPVQSPTDAPEVDVQALLAEMKGQSGRG